MTEAKWTRAGGEKAKKKHDKTCPSGSSSTERYGPSTGTGMLPILYTIIAASASFRWISRTPGNMHWCSPEHSTVFVHLETCSRTYARSYTGIVPVWRCVHSPSIQSSTAAQWVSQRQHSGEMGCRRDFPHQLQLLFRCLRARSIALSGAQVHTKRDLKTQRRKGSGRGRFYIHIVKNIASPTDRMMTRGNKKSHRSECKQT